MLCYMMNQNVQGQGNVIKETTNKVFIVGALVKNGLEVINEGEENEAISETLRRRKIQEEYNLKHGIVPHTIIKEIREIVSNDIADVKKDKGNIKRSKKEQQEIIAKIEKEMKEAAKALDFERAMELRDILFELKSE